MELEIYFLDSFKNGQFDKTEEAKSKSETGKIIRVFDGDVTTYLYELPSWYDENNQKHKDELLNALISAFLEDNIDNMGIKGNLDIINDEIYFYLDYPSDDLVDYTVIDEDGDEFYFSYIKKSEQEFWLYHQDFISNVKKQIEDECGEVYANKFLESLIL